MQLKNRFLQDAPAEAPAGIEFTALLEWLTQAEQITTEQSKVAAAAYRALSELIEGRLPQTPLRMLIDRVERLTAANEVWEGR